ncbi:MAG: SWIM zinc finger family protein [Steroidobacteraceae bacterium]
MNESSDWRDWAPSRPRPVEGGIAARSKRGVIGETWWSQRFIELLESFGVGSRLQRGRNYARRGQVAELEVEPGIVIAKVQGSRYTPYRVRIRVKLLSEPQWRRVEKAMAAQALPLAKLLAGEMPHDIQDVFESCKLKLFPRSNAELKASCTCPDWENPCKHIAAAYYILAERFDQDPFLIFAWRGRDKDELLERLRARRVSGAGRASSPAARPSPPERGTVSLAEQLDSFWRSGPALADLHVSPLASDAPDTLMRQLGPAPVEVAGQNLIEVLAPAYTRIAQESERRALT